MKNVILTFERAPSNDPSFHPRAVVSCGVPKLLAAAQERMASSNEINSNKYHSKQISTHSTKTCLQLLDKFLMLVEFLQMIKHVFFSRIGDVAR